MAFQREKCETFFWGGRGAWLRTPLRDRARGTKPSLAVNTIGDEGYVNSVQPPLSEIPGSAPDMSIHRYTGVYQQGILGILGYTRVYWFPVGA